ncbi:hypothetical protein HY500_00675 [Candidatus Woesearchaeota archaeon]|nr:hypothetical protein [Candidatus Woesearchaeota archaeon]
MTWQILKTEIFEKKFSKLDKSIQQQIESIRDQLKINPYIGKPLHVDYLREKKVGKFRIYYLIYQEYVIIYMITISEKKDQQKAINTIRLFLDKYHQEIENWIKEHKH